MTTLLVLLLADPWTVTHDPWTITVAPAQEPLTLVVLGASWCGPCRSLKPDLAVLHAAGYPIEEVDADSERGRRLMADMGFGSVPAFVMMRGDKPVEIWSGVRTRHELMSWFVRLRLDPKDKAWFERNHRWISRSTCTMLGCPIHSYKVLVDEEGNEVEPAEERGISRTATQPTSAGSFFRKRKR